VELKFGDVGFRGGRKTGEPKEKPSEQGENQQQTQPTYGTGPESNSGHINWWQASTLTTSPSLRASIPSLIIVICLTTTAFFASDVNKCKPNPCPRDVNCTHLTNGSYVCNCVEVYRYHSITDKCEDINECKTGSHTCNKTTSECENLTGSHRCNCFKGFKKSKKNCVGQYVTFS